MTFSERLITVNLMDLFHDAEGYMLSEDDLMWALGMSFINNYAHHPLVYQLEDATIKRVNEKAAEKKEARKLRTEE
jgi:hypothetical protein